MLDCPIEVRTAVPADRFALLDLIRQMHGETGLAPLDEAPVRRMIWRGVHQEKALVGIIEGKPDKQGARRIEGSIGLFADPWWYSSAERLYDLWNFVAEPYRRSTHAKKLLEFAKYAATMIDRPLVMAMLESEKTSAKLRLYERQLPKRGAFFVFNGADSPKVAQATPLP